MKQKPGGGRLGTSFPGNRRHCLLEEFSGEALSLSLSLSLSLFKMLTHINVMDNEILRAILQLL
jgi:hypothetical protein